MEGQELKDGKERVKLFLIDPLTTMGMVRKRGVKLEAHEDFLSRLMARLAYMDEEDLGALCEAIERNARGGFRNCWPPEVSIMNWARELRHPPSSQSRLVRTYLQSGAGIAARDNGYLVELYWYLKKKGHPPQGNYSMSKIKDAAEQNQRERARIRRARERGEARSSELDWLQHYMDTRRLCGDIIKAKHSRAA